MRWLNDEADALSRVIKRCLKTGFWTTAWLEDGALSCSRNGWNGKVDSSLAGLKSDKGLLADVRELLAHDVDGFRAVYIDVSERVAVRFRSDVVEGLRYEIEYTPEIRWPASDPLRVAPYWYNTYAPPIE